MPSTVAPAFFSRSQKSVPVDGKCGEKNTKFMNSLPAAGARRRCRICSMLLLLISQDWQAIGTELADLLQATPASTIPTAAKACSIAAIRSAFKGSPANMPSAVMRTARRLSSKFDVRDSRDLSVT